MKRIAAILISLLAASQAFADGTADALLTRMSAKLKAMGEYEVTFRVTAGTFSTEGRYTVSGREYQLTLGDAEVFCDGTTRYEVNNALEEITVDNVNLSERNILNNPVGGLDFIGEEFSSALISQDAATMVIRLTPTDKSNASTTDVTVDNGSQLPVRLVYRIAGDAITVELSSVHPSSTTLRRFDAKAYPDYEIIDFR